MLYKLFFFFKLDDDRNLVGGGDSCRQRSVKIIPVFVHIIEMYTILFACCVT